jgi:peptidyl-prolyl cis-trans isomerase A (cyclophilin A)
MSVLLSLLTVFLSLSLFIAPLECSSFAPSPSTWCAIFHTNITGSNSAIVMNVTRAWAPLGSDHFFSFFQAGFFNAAPSVFFRVVPQFVVQFGISGAPAENSKWNFTINDDPVIKSNLPRTVSYATAGPNTRTTQLFINWANNSFLDSQGFAPFAIVTSGYEVSEQIINPTPGNDDGLDQTLYSSLGNQWLETQHLPPLDFILKTEIGSHCPVQPANMPENASKTQKSDMLKDLPIKATVHKQSTVSSIAEF